MFCNLVSKSLVWSRYSVGAYVWRDGSIADHEALIVYLVNMFWLRNGLERPEVLVALMCVDGICSAISMSLSDKQVLAARKLIYVASLAQLTALGAIGYGIFHNPKKADHCNFGIFWWGFFDAFTQRTSEFVVFYLVRVISTLRTLWRAFAFTGVFNDAERLSKQSRKDKKEDALTSHADAPKASAVIQMDNLEQQTRLHRRTTNRTEQAQGTEMQARNPSSEDFRISYNKTRATAFSGYLEHLPQIVTTFAAIQRLLQQCVPTGGGWLEWGQTASVVACSLGLLHWLCYTTLKKIFWNLYRTRGADIRRLRLTSRLFPPGVLLYPSLDETVASYLSQFISLGSTQPWGSFASTALYKELKQGIELEDLTGIKQSIIQLRKAKMYLLSEELKRSFSLAGEREDSELVQLLLDELFHASSDDFSYQYALSQAATQNHQDATRLILATSKVDSEIVDVNFHDAAVRGSAAMIQIFVESSNIDVNRGDRAGGYTALMWAAYFDKAEVVDQLLKIAHIDPNVRNHQGQTAFILAVQNDNPSIASLLLNSGKIDVNVIDKSGHTALSWAVEHQQVSIVRELLRVQGVRVTSEMVNWSHNDDRDITTRKLLSTQANEIRRLIRQYIGEH